MLPEKINVHTGATFQSYNVLSIGAVKIPSGNELTGFSWDGILPGENRKGAPYIKEWVDPKAAQSLWSVYRDKKKKLKLLITETPVNHNVYLEGYDVDYEGGYGDYQYKIEFTQARDLKVYAEGERSGGEAESNYPPLLNKPAETTRTEPEPAKTHTVKSGETLWGIAQKYLGKGSRYPEIHAINQPPMGPDPSLIYPGQVLNLPEPGEQ
jgi:nucleoid-associated protein YgaU